MPADLGPLNPYLDIIELLGRVSHADMPARMASADVFAFPSLFEGSAVVTYEALACGLPSIVTPSAGSVVRDGIEGFLVPTSSITPWRSEWSNLEVILNFALKWRGQHVLAVLPLIGRVIMRL